MELPLQDRRTGGQLLGQALATRKFKAEPVIFALPRGGVPVAYEVAQVLGAPLDVFTVRKLGVPGQRELAMGAIATGGARVLNEDLIAQLHITPEQIDRVAATEEQELHRRERAYRDHRPPEPIAGRSVILVDDGLATGASMKAAIAAVKQSNPAEIIVAIPVAPPDTCDEIAQTVDYVVCLATPEPFYGVGQWYRDFSPTEDDEVRRFLADAAIQYSRRSAAAGPRA
jgi:predicted phosphoribosyltransferase